MLIAINSVKHMNLPVFKTVCIAAKKIFQSFRCPFEADYADVFLDVMGQSISLR